MTSVGVFSYIRTMKICNRRAWAILLAVAVYYALFALLSPASGDDVRFMFDWRLYSLNGELGFFPSVAAFADYMRNFDNARLDNIIAFVLLNYTPVWLTSVVVGLLAAATVGFGTALSAHFTARNLLWAAVWLMVFMPWRGEGIATVNSLNMLLPAASSLAFLLLLLSEKPLKRWVWPFALLFALIAGMMHEGFSAPVIAAAAVWWIITPSCRNKRFTALILAFTLGFAWVVSAPGILSRALNDPGHSGFQLFGFITLTMPMWLLAAAFAVFRRRPRGIALLLAVMTVVSTVVAGKSGTFNPRAWWIADLWASLLTLWLAATWLQRVWRGVVVATGALLAVFGGNVLYWQLISSQMNSRVTAEIAASPTGTAYGHYDPFLPKIVLLQPIRNLWYNELHLNSVNYRRTDGRIEAYVPQCLSRITAEQAAHINAGSAPGAEFRPLDSTGRFWLFENEIVGRDSVIMARSWGGECYQQAAALGQADFGTAQHVPLLIQRFVTVSGDTLLWLHSPLRNPPRPERCILD